MLRRAFRVAHWLLVGVLVCAAVATGYLCEQSYRRDIRWTKWANITTPSEEQFEHEAQKISLYSGRFLVQHNKYLARPLTRKPLRRCFLGFCISMEVAPFPMGSGVTTILVASGPIWPVAVCLAAYPVAFVAVAFGVPRARRYRRRKGGRCVQCGYDMRGSPTGQCPECGTCK